MKNTFYKRSITQDLKTAPIVYRLMPSMAKKSPYGEGSKHNMTFRMPSVDEIFDKENLPAFLKAARQRLKTIEFLGDDTEAFGLVETYENDFIGFCESFRDLNIVNRSS